MSVGSNLQEMENVVTKGAAPADPMPTLSGSTPGQPSVEDLGGPTPENYRADDDSAKLKEPTLATVKDVVNKAAKPAEPMPKMERKRKRLKEMWFLKKKLPKKKLFPKKKLLKKKLLKK